MRNAPDYGWQYDGSKPSISINSRNECYLDGIITLLLQDHRTVLTKSVCSIQYMVTDQHWATGAPADKAQYIVRSHQEMMTGLQFSAKDGKRMRVPNMLR